MQFRPLHDRVVVRRLEAEEKTAGGIIIPDTAKEKPMEGEIIAAGPGSRDETGKLVPLDVKAGDRILFGKWSGNVFVTGLCPAAQNRTWTRRAASPRWQRAFCGVPPKGRRFLLAARCLSLTRCSRYIRISVGPRSSGDLWK
jgi:chaperonin GroES